MQEPAEPGGIRSLWLELQADESHPTECLLWDIILTRQQCVAFANAAEYYFNCVTVCYFSLGAAFV